VKNGKKKPADAGFTGAQHRAPLRDER